nr:ATP-binding protein [Pseudomonadota bacterium]
MESDGTQRLFALAAPFLETLENGGILIADELEQRLHPALTRDLIGLFHNPKTNPKNAQLIFTTHDVSLLQQDIFRRDQIWFCERDGKQASTLFPLTDFKPRKGFEDFESYYMSGRYGALPIIGELSNALKNDGDK